LQIFKDVRAQASRSHWQTAWSRVQIAAFAPPHYDVTVSFSDTVFLFFLVLILFGPKKLPEIARQAGRLLAELRRASNEFKSQIETEIAHLEVEKKYSPAPPSAPMGTVPSLSANSAATEPISQKAESPTPAASTLEESPDLLPAPSSGPPEAIAVDSVPASQESHG
jgi:sec-independent protein translocase protein TatB